jgi:hypothetical protein
MSTITGEPIVGDRHDAAISDDAAAGDAGPGDDSGGAGPGAGYGACGTGGLCDTARDLARLSGTVHAELLAILRELARRTELPDGSRDLTEWCVVHLRVLRSTARELIRVAVALGDLPHLAALYATGTVSWDQIRFAVRFAEPGTDQVVAEELPNHTADQVAQLAKEHSTRRRGDDAETDRWTRLRMRRDHRRGGTTFNLFLPDGDAEPLRHELMVRAEQIGPDPVTGLWDPLERRLGQAMAMLGAAGLAADGDLDRALTVIHIDHDVLAGEADGNAVTESGSVLSAEVARRLACDAWIQYVAEDGDARPVGVGRRQRTVPRWLRRLIRHRDRNCRCCGGPIHHIHHIVHWTWLGPTDLDNLVGLCWGCHHRVHEGGWTITGDPNGALTFTNPYGESRTTVRQPLARTARRRAARPTGPAAGDHAPPPGGTTTPHRRDTPRAASGAGPPPPH